MATHQLIDVSLIHLIISIGSLAKSCGKFSNACATIGWRLEPFVVGFDQLVVEWKTRAFDHRLGERLRWVPELLRRVPQLFSLVRALIRALFHTWRFLILHLDAPVFTLYLVY